MIGSADYVSSYYRDDGRFQSSSKLTVLEAEASRGHPAPQRENAEIGLVSAEVESGS